MQAAAVIRRARTDSGLSLRRLAELAGTFHAWCTRRARSLASVR